MSTSSFSLSVSLSQTMSLALLFVLTNEWRWLSKCGEVVLLAVLVGRPVAAGGPVADHWLPVKSHQQHNEYTMIHTKCIKITT